jgi:hypothetical protein
MPPELASMRCDVPVSRHQTPDHPTPHEAMQGVLSSAASHGTGTCEVSAGPRCPTAEGDRSVPRYGGGYLRCSRMNFESQDGAFAVIGVAFVITIGEPPRFLADSSPDGLTAPRTERLPEGRPAIQQDESHVTPPNVKQNTVSDEWRALAGGGQGRFLSSGLSVFISAVSVPSSLRFAWTRVANRQQRQLHRRSLHRKFIAQPPCCEIPMIPIATVCWAA